MTLGRSLVPAFLAAAALLGCGARSELDALGGTSGGGTGAGAATDPCPSAVSGPKAMAGNCSTRDGRSRIAAPTTPHATWTTKLPTDTTGMLGPSALATDASGHAYVVTTGEFDESVAALRRVGVADGAIDWTSPITPDEQTGTPVVLSSGGVDLFAYGPGSAESVFTFDPASGSSASTTFGVSLYNAASNLAVGADGSLYVTHEDNVGGANTTTYVSRVAPTGAVLWTSVDLATLGPAPMDGEVDPSTVALGKDDLVVIVVGVLTNPGEVSVATAFDPATGVARWSTPLPGELVGGPVVRSDGTIVALLDATGGATSLVLLDPQTGTATTSPLASAAVEIFGVTTDGLVIAGADTGNGITGIVALQSDGTPLWTHPGPGSAILAAGGTILALGPGLMALDGATGETTWELPQTVTGSCTFDVALASDGSIVGLQCDGTLFGASD